MCVMNYSVCIARQSSIVRYAMTQNTITRVSRTSQVETDAPANDCQDISFKWAHLLPNAKCQRKSYTTMLKDVFFVNFQSGQPSLWKVRVPSELMSIVNFETSFF